jgi:hypothetical protein
MPKPTNVYDELCDAIKKLDAGQEVHARNELVRLHVISWSQGMDVATAISTFRMLAQKLHSD